jgi:hypothetical protein
VSIQESDGRQATSTIPTLEDGRSWLLAVDFDKHSWADDVAAFVDTCRAMSLPGAVERSRSGEGAHVWFFFAEPVLASTARKMGCYLITQTMARRHELSLESYDRLFPNQDTLPRGGFGNLIALPLQHGARQRGNTVFVDDRLAPFSDQWAFLASIRPIDPATVEAIAHQGTRRGEIIGLRISQTEDVGLRATLAGSVAAATEGRPPDGPGSGRGSSRTRAASLRREGAPALGPPESDQAPRGLPKSGVLPAAEGSPVDDAHSAGDRVRRRSATASRAAARLWAFP